MNHRTENWSVVWTEVQDNLSVYPYVNRPFVDFALASERIFWAGEAENFCVADTIMDLRTLASKNRWPLSVLLSDATSSIPGFKHLTDAFYEKMGKDLTTANMADIL